MPLIRNAFDAAHMFIFGMLAVIAVTLLAAPQARAVANESETFVQQNIDKGLGILNDKSLSDDQRRDQFRQFILALTDMKRIAYFTLGQYRRGASDADVNTFVGAFTDYANAVYESHLSRFSGQGMKVTGSTPRSATDNVVYAQVIDPKAQQPINVAFRVISDTGQPLVVDIQVEGIWLAIDQREQFTALLQRSNGNIQALIDHLKKRTDQIRSGSASRAAPQNTGQPPQ